VSERRSGERRGWGTTDLCSAVAKESKRLEKTSFTLCKHWHFLEMLAHLCDEEEEARRWNME
jgi:hypothetical protein